MNHHRAYAAGASALLVLLCLTFTMPIGVAEITTAAPRTVGESLSFTDLAANERISIEYMSSGCRYARHWQFVAFGGRNPRLAVITVGEQYENGLSVSQGPTPVGAIPLLARDCRGLDDLIYVYRHPSRDWMSTTAISIRLVYYRDEKRIGVEEFSDTGEVEYWLYHRDEDGFVSSTSGVTPQMVSFPKLFSRALQEGQASRL